MTKLAEAAQLMRESGWYFDYRTLFLLFGALFEITYIYLSQVLRVLLSIIVVTVIAPPVAILMATFIYINVVFRK
jgi:hypothetical protein